MSFSIKKVGAKTAGKVLNGSKLIQILSPVIGIAIARTSDTKQAVFSLGIVILIDTVLGALSTYKKFKELFSLKELFSGLVIKVLSYGILIYIGYLSNAFISVDSGQGVIEVIILTYLFLVEVVSSVKHLVELGVTQLEPVYQKLQSIDEYLSNL